MRVVASRPKTGTPKSREKSSVTHRPNRPAGHHRKRVIRSRIRVRRLCAYAGTGTEAENAER
jgi:hypothetical protein